MALPNEFAYSSLKPSAAPARGYVARLTPEAGTSFSGGQMFEITIPCGRPGEYLRATESSLCFRVQNSGAYAAASTTVNNVEFSGGAWSVIQKISVFHGAALISEIDDYASLHQLLYNGTASAEYTQGIGHAIHGTAQSTANAMKPSDLLKGATIQGRQTSTTGPVGEYYAALQLINPIIGTTAERAIPTGLMSADIRVQITLNPDETAFVYSGTPVITYDQVEFHAQIVQLDPTIDQEVAAANDGVLSFHAADFRMYAHSIRQSAAFDIVSLPMRFSSLRYALHIMRPQTNISAAAKRSIDGREKATLISYQFRRGGELVPQRPVAVSDSNTSQVTLELLKIFGKLESLGADHGIMFTDKGLFTNNDTSGSSTQGQFVFGADLNAFSSSLDDLVNSGANLLSTPLALELNFSSVPHDTRLTSFANYDMLVILDMTTGLLNTRF